MKTNATPYGEIGFAVVVHGKEVREYPHERQYLVEARHGTEYGLQIWNNTNRRVEAIVTVDGLNIITGKEGDWKSQTGYIIDAHSKPQVVPGFKIKGREGKAAAFTFGGPDESYAALVDKPNNIGVIGAAFFFERPPVQRFRDEILSLERGGRLGTMRGGATRGITTKSFAPSAGTAFGREVDFKTGITQFARETTEPAAILVLYYETAARLKEMGIDIYAKPKLSVANPFPAVAEGCTPPAGWDPARGQWRS